MAHKDLIPLNMRTKSEQKRIVTMGGIASGKVRSGQIPPKPTTVRKNRREMLLYLVQNVTALEKENPKNPAMAALLTEADFHMVELMEIARHFRLYGWQTDREV